MPKETPKFKPYRPVVVLRLRSGDTYIDAHGIYIQPCNHPDYEGRHVVRVNGVDLAIPEDRIVPDYED